MASFSKNGSEVLPRKIAMLDFSEIQTSRFKENANVILL